MKDIFYQNNYKLIVQGLFFLVGFSLPFSYAFNIISYGILFILISSLFLISGLMPIVISSLFHIKYLNQLERVRSSESLIYKVQYFIYSGDSVGKQNLERVIKVISSNLFIGLGADGGLELLQKKREILTKSFVNKRNAHNSILEILLRYGIIGLSIYLIIIFNLIQKARYTDNYFLSWLLIVFIISGITESYLQRQIGLVFFVFLSLLLYIYKYETKLT
jgi:O-antigen ligase